MLRILSLFAFIQSVVAQFRDPILTLSPPTVPVLTIGSVAPIRTIPTITRPITRPLTTTSTTIISTTPITTFLPQSTEPNNLEEINNYLNVKKEAMSVLNSIKPPNLKFYEISKDVNNPLNNDPTLIKPIN